MVWGHHEEFLEDTWKQTGIMPPALSSKPTLHGWMDRYLKGFWTLCSKRSYGMGPNPISFSEIAEYFDRFIQDDLEEFLSIISTLDEKWMSIMAEKSKGK